MTLIDYITQIGDKKAADLFSVKLRTVMSWRLGERIPRADRAEIIVAVSPVTYEGIFRHRLQVKKFNRATVRAESKSAMKPE